MVAGMGTMFGMLMVIRSLFDAIRSLAVTVLNLAKLFISVIQVTIWLAQSLILRRSPLVY
jgi:hypothetical protein